MNDRAQGSVRGVILVAVALLTSHILGQDTSTTSVESIRNAMGRQGVDAIFSNGASLPRADNGYVATIIEDAPVANFPNIFILSIGTVDVRIQSLWFKDSISTHIADIDVGLDGTAVVVGSYENRSNRITNFIVTVDQYGNQGAPIDLGVGFTGERVCTLPDRSIWVLGATDAAEHRTDDTYLMRNYRADGQMIQHYLPRRLISQATVDFSGPHHKSTFLRCGSHNVIAYLGTYQLLFMVPYDTRTEVHYSVDAISQAKVLGLAYLADGAIYGTLSSAGGKKLLYQLVVGKSTQNARWTAVELNNVEVQDIMSNYLIVGQNHHLLTLYARDYKRMSIAPIIESVPR